DEIAAPHEGFFGRRAPIPPPPPCGARSVRGRQIWTRSTGSTASRATPSRCCSSAMRGARTSCSSTSIPQHRRKRCPASSTAGASYLPHERPRRRAAAGAVADETPQCRVVTPLVSEPEAPAELARWWLRCMWEIGSVLNFLHVRVPFLPSYPQRPADRRTGFASSLRLLGIYC
uniref:Uncharacterized protein n=4 Tax=Aegilops tauschii subsp. strangulata TaxID=200361 RepID=A0A453IIM5_AEGTS